MQNTNNRHTLLVSTFYWTALALFSCGAGGDDTSFGSTSAPREPQPETNADSEPSVVTSSVPSSPQQGVDATVDSSRPLTQQGPDAIFDSSVPDNVVELLSSSSVLDFEEITEILHYACVTCHLREPTDPLSALDWTLLSLDFTIGRGWILPNNSGASEFVTSFTQLAHLTSEDLPLPEGVNSVLSARLTQKVAEFIDQL